MGEGVGVGWSRSFQLKVVLLSMGWHLLLFCLYGISPYLSVFTVKSQSYILYVDFMIILSFFPFDQPSPMLTLSIVERNGLPW